MPEHIKSKLIEVYLEKRPVLLRFLIARFRNENTAEDILQEIYLKIEASVFRQPIENYEAFIFQMAKNAALDHRKKHIRQQNRDHNWSETNAKSASGEPIHDAPDTDSAIDAKREVQHLKELIEDLPPKCREVFVAHKLKGQSHAEISERLQTSKSNIENHMTRAIKYLARHLKNKNE